MHQLTSVGEFTLRVELTDWEGESRYAEYNGFSVGSEAGGYRLHIGHYHGNAGDGMSYSNGTRFSTYDRDRDQSSNNCATRYGGGGWWYNDCYVGNLNGVYRSPPHHTTSNRGGIEWHGFKSTYYYSMKEAIMKIYRFST